MPLDPVAVAVEVSKGLSAVCATCTKFWRARDAGLAGTQCLARNGCGSPLVGDCFHEYEGPITNFASLCFVCGKKPRYGLRAGNLLRVIGACETHVQLVHQIRAKGRELIPLRVQGAPEPPKPATKKSLFAAIAEVETHFAKKNGEDPEG